MSRPAITTYQGQLFRRQLNAALDYLEANGGGGGNVFFGPEPPDNPFVGQVWIDNVALWAGPNPPDGAAEGDIWIDTD